MVTRQLARLMPASVKRGIKRALGWEGESIPSVRAIRCVERGVPAHDQPAPESPYRFVVEAPNVLHDLGEKYQPSKRIHHYLPYYWMHLRDIRLAVRSVCEIGMETDRSVRMWEEFFPNATIWGVDINPACKVLEGGRKRVRIGDQSDPAFLASLVKEAGHFDVVIDDGSHQVAHQLATFDFLFPHLSDHGVYVIEDTGGVVGDTELQTVESMKRLVDHVMYWPPGVPASAWPSVSTFPESSTWGDRNIIGVAFYRWLVFVFRGRNPQDNAFLARTKPAGASREAPDRRSDKEIVS